MEIGTPITRTVRDSVVRDEPEDFTTPASKSEAASAHGEAPEDEALPSKPRHEVAAKVRA